jgi:hypothetical protein
MGKYDREIVTVDCELKHQTEKAWLVVIEGEEFWCPKSIGEFTATSADGVVGELEAPTWWVEKENIPI